MKLPRRKFLRLAAGAAALPTMERFRNDGLAEPAPMSEWYSHRESPHGD